jgi:oxygen-independent coproporphyrinogen III oxidase
MDLKALVQKYSQAGPRYTSYPTAPVWSGDLGPESYRAHLQSGFLGSGKTLALYVHIPFCESLCYYCGCNIQITHDHSRSGSYVDALLLELKTVAQLIGGRRTLTQISWGGGTPTFLTIDEVRKLQEGTLALFDLASDADVSIEIDPRVTSDAQLVLLRQLGFNRVSLGVQDFSLEVQKAVNRIQPAEMTRKMLDRCKELGYKETNFDLIYGLPHQTLGTFEKTVDEVIRMQPSRIALYNYARLPNLVKHQAILEDKPFPEASERIDIFAMAFEKLTAAGYGAIGMDHFSHKTDSLYRALSEGTLYRNFMGYVVRKGTDLVGIGASAIGELGDAYFQNVRGAKEYEEKVRATGLAAFRGHRLSLDDQRRKWIIQTLMCRFRLDYPEYEKRFGESFPKAFSDEMTSLAPLVSDGLVVFTPKALEITETGRLFIRNVAMVFDAYLKGPQKVTYSKTV